ncbi:MAG: DegT/DnrJ/EryC1/StrS family aminotransferase [Rhodospirillales bacterium]|nr:DegT/DnrJ/EryC1/StrS family aminotransferase [Rhodospirillales bacterium]
MTKSLPAILGGAPARTTPFVVGPIVDETEERLVLDAIRNHDFSRYIGASSPDINTILRLSSRDAAVIQANWHFLGGPNIRLFAAEFAEKFGCRYAIPINSATSGLSVALAAAGVGPGDEVLVPALSFSATASAILLFNSIPVFVDVDPKTFCIDPEAAGRAITPRTRAILPVHLLGNACDMEALQVLAKRHHLKIIEDCAQAPGTHWRGRPVGTIGDAGVFSFQQSKNITTGEGGMITTNDPDLAARARLIMNHGETVMDEHHSDIDLANIVGFNFRMIELAAALGRAQLGKLDAANAWRNRNYMFLAEHLGRLPGFTPPYVPQDVDFICHVAAFLYDERATGLPRDLFIAAIRAEGIPMGTGYTRLMYENPMFLRRIAYGTKGSPWTDGADPSEVRYVKGQCPVGESLIYQKFLWMYHIAHPSTLDDMSDIVRAVEKVLAGASALNAAAEKIRNSGLGKRAQGRIEGRSR